MIYLNNAATTYPKPQCVIDAHAAAFNAPPAGQFRSGGQGPERDLFEVCRKRLGELFGIKDWERIYFTSGATDAMNQLLSGMHLEGRKILVTQTEHNSVLRPIYNGVAKGAQMEVLPCDSLGKVLPEEFEKRIGNAALLILNHCSNVTGMVQDVKSFGEIAKRHGVLFFLDASQSAGCIPIDCGKWQVDGLVFTGHKSLFGPQGTGGFYLRKGIRLIPSRYGGTGRDSSRLTYEDGDYEYEVGTQNSTGIRTLLAGVDYLLDYGVETVAKEEQELMGQLYQGLNRMGKVTVYGEAGKNKGPVLSMNIQGWNPADAAYVLQNAYDIVVRTGLHCAPLIHNALGTMPYGTVRVSISALTREEEISRFLEAVREICG